MSVVVLVQDINEFYTIDTNGVIRSKRTGRVMKSHISRHGYSQIGLKFGFDKQKHFLIHRLLAIAFLPNPDNKNCVDHKNHDKLDNSLTNLRWCTISENNHNMSANLSRGTSIYKGVSFYKNENKWIACVYKDNVRIFHKRYDTEIDAARSYNEQATIHFGSFACINNV